MSPEAIRLAGIVVLSLHLLLLNHLPPNLWNELEQSLGCYDLPIDNMHRPPSMLSVSISAKLVAIEKGSSQSITGSSKI